MGRSTTNDEKELARFAREIARHEAELDKLQKRLDDLRRHFTSGSKPAKKKRPGAKKAKV